MLQRISHAGIRSVLSQELSHRIVLTNQIAILEWFVAFFYAALFFFFNQTLLGLGSLITSFFFLTSILWNKYGFYNLSRLSLIFCGHFSLFIFACFLGKDAGVQYIFFAGSLYPLILFEFYQKTLFFLSFFITLFSYFLLELTQYQLISISFSFSPHFLHTLHFLMIVTTFIFITIFLRFFLHNEKTHWYLKKGIEEKELLLREVHHRVRNNLQLISSLLHLNTDYVKDHHVSKLISDFGPRLFAMSTIHDIKENSATISKVNVSAYVTRLCDHLKSKYLTLQDSISIQLHIPAHCLLNIHQAHYVGLLLTEMVSNSIKHAFSTSTGHIDILWQQTTSHITFHVKDNGVGIHPRPHLDQPKTFGFKLIQLITEQLQASIDLDIRSGTQFKICFLVHKPKKNTGMLD